VPVPDDYSAARQEAGFRVAPDGSAALPQAGLAAALVQDDLVVVPLQAESVAAAELDVAQLSVVPGPDAVLLQVEPVRDEAQLPGPHVDSTKEVRA
jgi:hypothetical protein